MIGRALAPYLLGAGLALIAGAYFLGRSHGVGACEARVEQERQATQERENNRNLETIEETRRLLLERQILQTRIEGLENEVNSLPDVCRVGPDGVRRLYERWNRD